MCFIPAGELRTWMLHGVAKIKKQTKNRKSISGSKPKYRKWFQDILRYEKKKIVSQRLNFYTLFLISLLEQNKYFNVLI